MTQVTWANNRGGSGTARGTASWTVNGIVLQSGVNVLTVTARDAAGNTSTDALTVTYTPRRHDGADGDDHRRRRTMPTHSGLRRRWRSGGRASDNVAVTQVTWSNNRGGSGTARGTASWTVTGSCCRAGQRADGDGARCGRQHRHRRADGDLHAAARRPNPDGDDHLADGNGDAQRDRDAAVNRGQRLGQRGGDAGDVDERPGWQRHGERHGELDGQRDRAAERVNVLTVTARDAAGNTGTDILTVTYTPSDTTNADGVDRDADGDRRRTA